MLVSEALAEVQSRLRDTGKTLFTDAKVTTLLNLACKDFSRRTRCIGVKRIFTASGTGTGLLTVPESTFLGSAYASTLSVNQVMFDLNTDGTAANDRWYGLDLSQSLDDLYNQFIGGGIYYQSAFPTHAAFGAYTADYSGSIPNLVTSAGVKSMFIFPALISGTYTNRFWFEGTRTHTDIAQMATTSKLEFPDDLQEAPILFCEWRGLPRDGRYIEAINRAKADYFDLVAEGKRGVDIIDSGALSAEPGPGTPGAGRWR